MTRPKIAIAGATGFIGSALRAALGEENDIVGLTRGPSRRDERCEWRSCDLYSLSDVERGLAGCDVAIYLVHSMLPSARLTQARFEDLDLILADNFARAAAHQGVKHIIYLGGLIPSGDGLSTHLNSRLEVEHTLTSHGVPVTALRAGMVVGPGGSSMHILLSLVRRLPAMVTPKWTESPTQPIALSDVVRAVHVVLEAPSRFVGAFDIGGPDVMSYREMMQRTARLLGYRRPTLPLPVLTPRLSVLWVSLVTGMPRALVGPLVGSLRHPMVVEDNDLQRALAPDALGFEAALEQALAAEAETPRVAKRRVEQRSHREARTVRSVQRLPLPDGRSAAWVALEYLRWLPAVPIPGLRCETDGDRVHFTLGPSRLKLLSLRLADERSPDGRALFYIVGGALAHVDDLIRPGRLEFREVLDGEAILGAIHDFRPTLPFSVYNATQALAHLWVMRRFGAHLARQPGRDRDRVTEPVAGQRASARSV